MNWKQYIQSNNPVAAALISKMGYSRTERVQVKKEFLRMLVKMEINPAKMELINGFFETYLSLNESEEKTLMEEIKQLNSDEKEQILKLPNSWVEKGKKEGIQEGLRKIALNMLKEGLSIELIARVTNLDYEEIEKISKHNL
jgi:predicted transposase/invertase (TIGR01784 family)